MSRDLYTNWCRTFPASGQPSLQTSPGEEEEEEEDEEGEEEGEEERAQSEDLDTVEGEMAAAGGTQSKGYIHE
jgi:hypothetical protein